MSRLDYTPLLEELGVSGGRVVGAQWYARCPIHNGHSQNFSVNVETGLWVCFNTGSGCGVGNLVSLISSCMNIGRREALVYLEQWEKGIAVEDVSAEELLQMLGLVPTEGVHAPAARRSDSLTRTLWPLWWVERGFDVDDWARWDCAMDERTGDVVIPVFDAWGELHGEVRRRMPGVEPRYLYTLGMDKSKLLFGEQLVERHCDELVLVEGPLDAIWCWHHGIPAVALLGSMMSFAQAQRLLAIRPRHLVCALDSDEAGREGTKRLLPQMQAMFVDVRVVRWPDGVKDAQDMKDGDELRASVARATSVLEFMIGGADA